jgi:hypothetical protein
VRPPPDRDAIAPQPTTCAECRPTLSASAVNSVHTFNLSLTVSPSPSRRGRSGTPRDYGGSDDDAQLRRGGEVDGPRQDDAGRSIKAGRLSANSAGRRQLPDRQHPSCTASTPSPPLGRPLTRPSRQPVARTRPVATPRRSLWRSWRRRSPACARWASCFGGSSMIVIANSPIYAEIAVTGGHKRKRLSGSWPTRRRSRRRPRHGGAGCARPPGRSGNDGHHRYHHRFSALRHRGRTRAHHFRSTATRTARTATRSPTWHFEEEPGRRSAAHLILNLLSGQ